MQFPESWLRSFCNPALTSEQLADTLTMGGFEVEEQRSLAPPFTQVVVGHVVEVAPHPDADRLRVCQVDVGQGALLGIVCGAPNARVGIRVPTAVVGATLPPGPDGRPFVIKAAKLRGVPSAGMLCSARELGLSEDHEGLLELPNTFTPGQDIRTALQLDDQVFTIKLTPNLGHALSVHGLARELSALTGEPLRTPELPAVLAQCADVLPVKISAPDLCGRFSGRIIRNLNTQAKTPDWMVDRLVRCGQRSVSALVDISNYVLFEYGRPTHIFDLDKIEGGLDVRWARAGEQLELLNGNTITLDEKVGVIADARAVESLAGIMGGQATAVSDDTTSIYVEAAFWWPEAVAGRSRRFNFATEAGHRFERGVDPALTVEHIEHITRLILDICGTPDTVCGPIDDQQPNMPQRPEVALRPERAAKIIGMPISTAQCAEVMQRLGFAQRGEGGRILVTPPPHRFDITIEEDLIEEVARLVGYQNLPDTPALAPVQPRVRSERARSAFDVRHTMAGLGYLETINFSFVEEAWERDLAGNDKPIRLLNPIASQMNVMRSSLIGSLLAVVKHNVDRRAACVRVFEVGRVFLRDPNVATSDSDVQGVHQPLRVAGTIYGPASQQSWEGSQRAADFYDAKGDVEALLAPRQAMFVAAEHPALHPGRCASIQLGGRTVGHVGELHPRWCQHWELPHAPVLFELDLSAVLERDLPTLQPVPRQLPVERDLAVIVRETVTHDQLLSCARAAKLPVPLRQIRLFDIYRPKPGTETSSSIAQGEKSMALHLELGGDTTPLTEDNIEASLQSVLSQLQADLGARLRG